MDLLRGVQQVFYKGLKLSHALLPVLRIRSHDVRHCKQHQIQFVLVERLHHANVQMRRVEAILEGYSPVMARHSAGLHLITSSEDLGWSCLTAQSTDLLLGEQQPSNSSSKSP